MFFSIICAFFSAYIYQYIHRLYIHSLFFFIFLTYMLLNNLFMFCDLLHIYHCIYSIIHTHLFYVLCLFLLHLTLIIFLTCMLLNNSFFFIQFPRSSILSSKSLHYNYIKFFSTLHIL